jgi:hypothetical protein
MLNPTMICRPVMAIGYNLLFLWDYTLYGVLLVLITSYNWIIICYKYKSINGVLLLLITEISGHDSTLLSDSLLEACWPAV